MQYLGHVPTHSQTHTQTNALSFMQTCSRISREHAKMSVLNWEQSKLSEHSFLVTNLPTVSHPSLLEHHPSTAPLSPNCQSTQEGRKCLMPHHRCLPEPPLSAGRWSCRCAVLGVCRSSSLGARRLGGGTDPVRQVAPVQAWPATCRQAAVTCFVGRDQGCT